ncbi:PBP1A family penicillin-binding protein [Alkalinema sp. FACHB-956]|uniref:PBP1A family penicillin-binding protein n=1 Tax=Alkalinema sp. FACHB-956 TaxID=2692768 RepID=UPI0016827327|nr:penicillin-binding protein 1A [Alkalinema sp. FACHB-956]
MSSNTFPSQPQNSDSPFQFLGAVTKVTGATLLGITMLTSSVIAGGLVGLAISFRNLPDVRVLRNYTPSETTHIYDIKGKPLASLHGEANREVMPLNHFSPHLKRAVLAIEDSYFFTHKGVNPSSVGRALKANFSKGETVEGGSTLTMQLVKNLFLSPQRAFSRKVAEAVLALRIEQVFSKDQIFEMYLNQVYWGHNTYGAETAARSYFGKSASELNLAESAMMAGLIQAPEALSPFLDMKAATRRQHIVLQRMKDLQWITEAEEKEARNYSIKLGKITSFQRSEIPYVTEAIVQELTKKFGRDMILKGGLRIQATIDTKLQRIAEETVRRGIQNLNGSGVYADQMALVSVDPRTHYVKAMVGGVDYKKSQYNRATQALRQPGSSFKPFVYYAAFASGKYAPDSTVMDTPVGYPDGYDMYYPQNYDRTFSGAISIRRALEVSRNIPAVRLGQEVGLNKVVEICRSIGIKSPIDPVISLPLGSVDITPLEMANAYATFASNGWYADPTLIAQATDSRGAIVLDNRPKPRLVLDSWSAAAVNDVLQGVITRGTATSANIGRPAAGKTGTTSSERDIWFVGYVPQLSTAVWVGNDDYSPLGYGATGGTFVAPIWRDFMAQAVKDLPVERFRPPSDFPRP